MERPFIKILTIPPNRTLITPIPAPAAKTLPANHHHAPTLIKMLLDPIPKNPDLRPKNLTDLTKVNQLQENNLDIAPEPHPKIHVLEKNRPPATHLELNPPKIPKIQILNQAPQRVAGRGSHDVREVAEIGRILGGEASAADEDE